MKIQYCSDLHLEFKDNQKYLEQNPILPNGEILLLAGDIVPIHLINQHGSFFDYISDRFEEVYWIAGNHEYYHSDLQYYSSEFHEKIRSNVHFLNNKTVQYKGVNIICSTLWSHISEEKASEVERSVTDFYTIKLNGEKFTPDVFNNLHKTHLDFIKGELKVLELEKTVVMTHHVPSFKNYKIPYMLNNLDEAFIVELSDFIETSKANYWIYGHHHRNAESFEIGQTKMLTNQLGYVKYAENFGYNSSKVFSFEED